MKTIIFDFDGVILNSVISTYNVLNDYLTDFEVPKPGNGFEEWLYGDLSFDKLMVHYGVNYEQEEETLNSLFYESSQNAEFYSGIIKLLKKLHNNDNVKLGIVTNNSREVIDNHLKKHNIAHYFESVITKSYKPLPTGLIQCIKELEVNADSVIYIGDTSCDADCAHRAGVRFIGVTYGYGTNSDFEQFPNISVVKNVKQLRKQIRKQLRVSLLKRISKAILNL